MNSRIRLNKIFSDQIVMTQFLMICGETICFVLGIIYFIQTIILLSTTEFLTLSAVFEEATLQGLIVTALLLILWPFFLRYSLIILEKNTHAIRAKRFQANIMDLFTQHRQIGILTTAEEYHLTADQVRKILYETLDAGFLKGSFSRIGSEELFELDPNFHIEAKQLRRLTLFREKINQYLKTYRIVALVKIANAFELPQETVEKELQRLLEQKQIQGYIENENFVQDLTPFIQQLQIGPKFDSCPFCSKDNLPKSKYCSHCGKNLELDEDELRVNRKILK